MSISLNIISTSKDVWLLERCLKSFDALDNFDEIIIVNTSKDDILEKKFSNCKTKVLNFEWETPEHPFGNFEGARNLALFNSKSDYVMWLDSDDYLLDEDKQKFKDLINNLTNLNTDYILLPYVLAYTPPKTIHLSINRERIFKREGKRWSGMCHETIVPKMEFCEFKIIEEPKIYHLPIKNSEDSSNRNLQILKFAYDKDPNDYVLEFYLARDSFFAKDYETFLKLSEDILFNMKGSLDVLYECCLNLVYFYAFGQIKPLFNLCDIKKENLNLIEGYLQIAKNINPNSQEVLCFLGDIETIKGNVQKAIKYYLYCLELNNPKFNSPYNKINKQTFKVLIPASRLANLFFTNNKLGLALHYCDVALSTQFIPELFELRKAIIKRIIDNG